MPRVSALALVLGMLAGPSAAAEGTPYYDLIYDYEVASFCGLVGKDVHDAFWRRRQAFEATSPMTETALTKIRIRAMADADREMQNRGLGGYKPWCESDGRAGVRRILD